MFRTVRSDRPMFTTSTVAFAAAVTLLLSGCGGSASDSSAPSGGADSTVPAVEGSTVSPAGVTAAVDCPALRLREFNQALGFAAAPGAIFLQGTDEMKASVAELPEMVKALRVLEPYEQKVPTLPPLAEALDRFQQRADAAAAALDGQDSTRENFNAVEADLRDELTLDIGALGSAMARAGCPQ